MGLWRIWFWPDVAVRRKAQYAINEGAGAALIVAIVTGIVGAIGLSSDSLPGIDAGGMLISAGVFAGVTIGIYSRSRVAAIAGLALYVVGRIYYWEHLRSLGALLFSFAMAMAFVNGIRGTFAYHKMPPAPVGLPPVEESFRAMRAKPRDEAR